MSKFVQIKTELRDVAVIRQALDDLKMAYTADTHYTHVWSGRGETVALLVKLAGATFGLRAGADGVHEALADDMLMPRIRPALARIQQRYAYHKVVAETKRAGFELVEEAQGADQVIRLTVRRWS